MNVTTVGIDLVKSILQLQGGDERGNLRVSLGGGVCKRPLLGWRVSAAGTHREAYQPQFLDPSGKGEENDSRDTEAIGDAVSRPHVLTSGSSTATTISSPKGNFWPSTSSTL